MTNNIQEFSFPTVAIIRKGTPKRKAKNRKGEDIEVVGNDLQEKFRIAWTPGSDFARTKWDATYGPGTYQPTEIRGMIFLPTVWDALQIYNEAYQAGRMVLRADDRQILMQRNPLTGEYIIRDGEPHTPYTPGQDITYTRGDRTYTLPVRTSIRLKLFIPELGLPVQFLLKSTSYYDGVNLRQQFGAVQALANMLNKGIAGGIPIILYRTAQEVTWNKDDGGAQRVSKWLVNVRVDERWITAATQRMSQFALTGQMVTGLLEPPKEIAGTENPDLADDDDEEETTGEWTPVGEPEQPPHPADMPLDEAGFPMVGDVASTEQPIKIEKKFAPDMEQAAPRKPLNSDQLRDRLGEVAKKYREQGLTKESKPIRELVKDLLEKTLDGVAINNQQAPAQARGELTFHLLGERSLDKIGMEYIKAIKAWLKPTFPNDVNQDYTLDPIAEKEARNAYREAVGLTDLE